MNETTRSIDSPASLVDAHCHIDLYPSPADIVRQCEESRIYTVAVTNAPSVFSHTQALCAGKRYVRAAVGLHPELVRSHGHEIDAMLPLIDQTRYIGEIGLDFTTNDATERRRQQEVFEQILTRCATHRNKILTIHSRRAAANVIAAVGADFPGTVILHWFSGSSKLADTAAANGMYFSINPAMVRSATGQKLIARFPRDRILTETDGPFVSIQGQPARPKDVAVAVDFLSQLWAISPEESRAIVRTNLQEMLNCNR